MISVIIPVYNVSRYLTDCLESVIDQSFEDKEVILVDDGSTDNSGDICEDYAARYSYMRVVHKKNGGLSSARNRGLDEAGGEWVVFLDSDDKWADKDCLTKLYAYAMSLNLDIVRFEYQAVNENMVYFEPRCYNKKDIEGCVLDNYTLVKSGIWGEWFPWLYLIKQSVISGLRFNEHTKFQEDIDFYCRLFAAKPLRCGYIGEKMYLYRKRPASLVTTYRLENFQGSLNLCDVFYEASQYCEDIKLSQLYINNSVMMYYWTLCSAIAIPEWKHRKEMLEKCRFDEYRRKALLRSPQAKIKGRYKLFFRLSPLTGLYFFKIRYKISIFIKSTIK